MEEIISNFDNKMNKINNDYKLVKDKIIEQNIDILQDLVELNESIENITEKLLNLKVKIYKNNLEKLDYINAKEVKEQILNEKINTLIKPLMLSLLLKYS